MDLRPAGQEAPPSAPLLADPELRVPVRIAKSGTSWHCRSRKRVILQKRLETASLEKQNFPGEQNLTIMLTITCISAYLRRSIGDLKRHFKYLFALQQIHNGSLRCSAT
jgi:hypothetical protein